MTKLVDRKHYQFFLKLMKLPAICGLSQDFGAATVKPDQMTNQVAVMVC